MRERDAARCLLEGMREDSFAAQDALIELFGLGDGAVKRNRECVVCGEKISANYNRMYCSGRCRDRAYSQRKRAARAANDKALQEKLARTEAEREEARELVRFGLEQLRWNEHTDEVMSRFDAAVKRWEGEK